MNKYEESEFNSFSKHIGHNIECVAYGNKKTGAINISIKCHDCDEILFTMNEPETCKEKTKYDFQWTMTENKYKQLKAIQNPQNRNKYIHSTNDMFGAVYCNQICIEFFHTFNERAWFAYMTGFEYSPNESDPKYTHKSTECAELDNAFNTERILRETSTFEEFKEKVEQSLTETFEKNTELKIKATTEVPEADKDAFFIQQEETLQLPDGKKIICPIEINMTELTDFDDLEYELWHTIESYLDRMGIRREDDDPDWATVKEVQTTILNILERSGVNINV